MGIWFTKPTVKKINDLSKKTMVEHLDIQFVEIGKDFLAATMPVDHRTKQPLGLLHGGASVVLAETLGSTASMYCIDPEKFIAVGIEINANHIRPIKNGRVTGIVKPVHLGRSTHIWSIEIFNDQKKLVNISRLTMAVLEK